MISDFDTTRDGRPVQAIRLDAHGLEATVLTYGAILQDLRFAGADTGLTLGSDHLQDYETTLPFHGSLVGPVCNRLSGACARIAGQTHRFEANLNGTHTLHSGSAGTHAMHWTLKDHGADFVTLSLDMPHGAGGFPGNRQTEARFELRADITLRLTVSSTTDAPTIVNFTNHSYWNLDGSDTFETHSLRIDASHYLPSDDTFTPTGEIAPVAGTAMDFQTPRPLRIARPPLDNTFVPNTAPGQLRDVLWLTGESGTSLTVATSEPGIHVFDCRGTARPGRKPYEGLAIEAQGWPDAPNKPGFPSIELAVGETRTQITEWRFSG